MYKILPILLSAISLAVTTDDIYDANIYDSNEKYVEFNKPCV